MDECFNKARELGNMVLKSELSKNLAEALNVYKNDQVAVNMLEKYNLQRKNLNEKIRDGSISNEDVLKITNELERMFVELNKHPVVGALLSAQDEYNKYVEKVLNILQMTISLQDVEDNCGSHCNSCNGCGM